MRGVYNAAEGMPVTLEVKSSYEVVKAQRENTAQRVLPHFGDTLPPSRLLCFLDDEDSPALRHELGPANRGLYTPIHDSTPMGDWPNYVTDKVLIDDGVNWRLQRVIDDLVYLHGTTSANEVSLTMTLAHELQHAVQHANVRELWAVNGLVPHLDRNIISALRLTWADIPIELEARIVSKRVAEQLFGKQRVQEHIDQKISERVTEADADDWRFIGTLTPMSVVDLEAGTRSLFQRLRNHRAELEAVLQERKKAENPDFVDVSLANYF